MPTKSDYQVVNVTDDTVYLVDLNWGRMSVTNDAENVVYEVYKRYGNKRIVYRDSDGRWDELEHEHGTFTNFLLLPIDKYPNL